MLIDCEKSAFLLAKKSKFKSSILFELVINFEIGQFFYYNLEIAKSRVNNLQLIWSNIDAESYN